MHVTVVLRQLDNLVYQGDFGGAQSVSGDSSFGIVSVAQECYVGRDFHVPYPDGTWFKFWDLVSVYAYVIAPFPHIRLRDSSSPIGSLRLGTLPSRSGASQFSAHGAGSSTPAFTAFRSGEGSRYQSSWGLKTYWKVHVLHFQKGLLGGFPRALVYD